jgi:hypothetical protein
MSLHDEVNQLLLDADAFVAGGQNESMVAAAEAKLGLTFPPSFRQYLLTWGNVSVGGVEYSGLTRNADFDNAGVPNCVGFTLRKRRDVGLPASLVVLLNKNDAEYVCIDTDQPLDDDERRVVIWDNLEREIPAVMPVSFIAYLHEELTEYLTG